MESPFKFIYERNGTTYTHAIPAPIECSIDEEKIAKEGSGRSGNTGSMSLEYLGIQTAVNLAWDLLPNSKDYINLYKILKSLPDFFTFVYPSPNGNNAEQLECYNNKWNISFFKITSTNTYFRGLNTRFISVNLSPIENIEPVLED